MHDNISLTSIFYMLFKIHELERVYTFKNNQKIDALHDDFKDIIEKTHTIDKNVA